MNGQYGKSHATEAEAYEALNSLFAAGEISGADFPAVCRVAGRWRIFLHDRHEQTYSRDHQR